LFQHNLTPTFSSSSSSSSSSFRGTVNQSPDNRGSAVYKIFGTDGLML
jgi:hypothetical protein